MALWITQRIRIGYDGSVWVADPGGAPSPVQISHKKDGRQRQPHRFLVSCPPPLPGRWIPCWIMAQSTKKPFGFLSDLFYLSSCPLFWLYKIDPLLKYLVLYYKTTALYIYSAETKHKIPLPCRTDKGFPIITAALLRKFICGSLQWSGSSQQYNNHEAFRLCSSTGWG